MSCHVMSCHVMSCHVMSCHVMSFNIMQCKSGQHNAHNVQMLFEDFTSRTNSCMQLFMVVKYVDIPDTVHLALVLVIVLVKEIHLSSA